MMHVKRNQTGEVVTITLTSPTPDGADGMQWEPVRGDEPEVQAFAQVISREANPMEATDLGLVRVIEDLIELLIDRSVIRFTDLPPAAQGKLIERRGTRAAMQSLSLLDGDQGDVI